MLLTHEQQIVLSARELIFRCSDCVWDLTAALSAATKTKKDSRGTVEGALESGYLCVLVSFSVLKTERSLKGSGQENLYIRNFLTAASVPTVLPKEQKMFQFFPLTSSHRTIPAGDAMMNAKTAQRKDGGTRVGDYVCQRCQSQFHYIGGKLRCPVCATQAAENLVPFYTEVDPEKDEMLTRDDFGQGD